KEWARRNGHHFEHMAMKIFQKAGISVFEIYRKEQKLIPIWLADTDYTPPEDNPLILEKILMDNIGKDLLLQKTGEAKDIFKDRPFAAAFAYDAATDSGRFIAAAAHLSAGYTPGTLEDPEGKYSFTIEPLNRLLMRAARHGLKVIPAYLYSSRTPTARELVNMIGAGITLLHIGDPNDSRDPFGPQALKQLQSAGIIQID